MPSLCKIIVASTLALQAAAKTIRIEVGNGGLRFNPNVTEAAKDDVLEFHYFALNHSVVQGRFDRPCRPAESNPIFSGFVPVPAGQESPRVFSVTVNDTNPLVFYCSQNNNFHCAKGMFAVVNGGPQAQNINSYKALISGNVTAVSPPGGPRGGVFSARNATSPSGTTDSASTATTATAPTATGTDAQTTPAPTGTGTTGGAGGGAPQTTSSRPSAGDNVQAPLHGLAGAVLAMALLL